MLYLESGVELQVVKIFLPVHKEFHGASPAVLDGDGGREGHPCHSKSGGIIQIRRRAFFEDLLVPSLDGTFPVEEVDDVAGVIG
jgi:hypothetical protein